LKKLVAILLLGAHLLGLGGYELVFKYFIHQSDVQIVKQMYDNKFNSQKLIEIKIPVHMPTIVDWTEYEHITGQIQLNGGYYNYIRLKMTRDTMYLLCIPNHDKTRLINANVIYAKNVSDIPSNKKSHTSLVKKGLSENEYNYTSISYKAFARAANTKARHGYVFAATVKTQLGIPGQPPDSQA